MWRAVCGYEGLYEINEDGAIRSLPRNGTVKEPRLIKSRVHKTGYLYCCLNKNGNQKNYQVHRLVALAFIPNLDNKPQVNHKDGNKLNNNITNLEWVTAHENSVHSIRILNHRPPKLNRLCKPIICLETKQEFISRRDAERKLGLASGSILHALKGKTARAGGFHWAYLAEPELQAPV